MIEYPDEPAIPIDPDENGDLYIPCEFPDPSIFPVSDPIPASYPFGYNGHIYQFFHTFIDYIQHFVHRQHPGSPYEFDVEHYPGETGLFRLRDRDTGEYYTNYFTLSGACPEPNITHWMITVGNIPSGFGHLIPVLTQPDWVEIGTWVEPPWRVAENPRSQNSFMLIPNFFDEDQFFEKMICSESLLILAQYKTRGKNANIIPALAALGVLGFFSVAGAVSLSPGRRKKF